MSQLNAGSLGSMTHGFNIVSIRVQHEGPVIIGVVMGAEARFPIVAPACGDCCIEEGIDLGARSNAECHMNRGIVRGALADPKIRVRRFTEARYITVASRRTWELNEY